MFSFIPLQAAAHAHSRAHTLGPRLVSLVDEQPGPWEQKKIRCEEPLEGSGGKQDNKAQRKMELDGSGKTNGMEAETAL